MRGLKISAAGRTRGDIPLIVCVSLMACFGCLMIYSASSYVGEVQYGDSLYFVKKQLLGVVAGGAAMAFFCFFPYYKLYKFRYAAVVIAAVLLALVFVPGIGVTNYGATRWIGFGSFTIQPSEIAKYAYALFTAAYFAKNYRKVKTVRGVLPVLGVGALFCVLVILEPNMSITMCLGLLMLALVFLSGTNLKTFAFVLIPCALAVPVLIIAEPYRLERLSAFLDPWSSPLDEGYQLIQSFYALGNGGLFGVGLFNSTQKYRFLPFAESDFILSVMGEELGFFGITVFFCACAFIIWRGLRIAKRCSEPFGYLLAAGFTLVYGIQVVINALVVSGTIPPTGLPLPLISSGNTSLIITMASMGVLFNISRSCGEDKGASRLLFGKKQPVNN
ncbi:MAG TPA: putative lipid II flippase FtsW [Candidatus Coproplasma stercoripullorum]|uniref:Probable peptidoglycan glycosyltransferase FtsW n=1 Tax=Candidatus Coproplasma stercoripullorum TaxID=2840751 RepID=A0A9D1AFG3_9FIRM|nr:putative lipid II flippase FtsW [Candidatus Coproplasma stercoripullorum]